MADIINALKAEIAGLKKVLGDKYMSKSKVRSIEDRIRVLESRLKVIEGAKK